MIPVELARPITQEVPVENYKAIACVNSVFSSLLQDELFWKGRFKEHDFRGAIHSQQPRRKDEAPSWRSRFREHWIAHRNWQQGRFRKWSIASGGEVCLVLDSPNHRAVSAPFPVSATEYAVRLWDLNSGKNLRESISTTTATSAVLDQQTLILGSRAGIVSLHDFRQKGNPTIVMQAQGEVSAIAGQKNSTALVVGTQNGFVNYVDLRSTCPIWSSAADSPVTATAISNNRVFYASLNGAISFRGVGTGRAEYTVDVGTECNSMLYSRGILYMGLASGDLLSSRVDDKTFSTLSRAESAVTCMDIYRDRLVAGHANGSITCRVGNGKAMHMMGTSHIIWKVACDASRILSSALDRTLLVHDFTSTV